MTAEPQIGYPGQHEGWQQTPPGYDLGPADGTPSGLSHAFGGYAQDPPSAPAPAVPQASFAGHDPNAPSGLSFAPPAPGYQEQAYAPAPQSAYSEPAPQAAYAPPPQAAYPPPPQAAYPPPPQAAYPEPTTPAYGAPGYLQPYGPPAGPTGNGPSIGPVIGFTFFFGALGAISAARRAERARSAGDSTGKYWIAFGATLVGTWVLGFIVGILMFAVGIAAAGDDSGPGSTSSTAIALQQSIVKQGAFTDDAGKTIKVKTATCAAQGIVPTNGVGLYKCTLGLSDGTKDAVVVSLDSSGRWKVIGQAK